jgi:transcriptional regulator with XRE-family HTH domain
LGRLLQERRDELGYSRTRLGELVAIKPTTIEAWELGRVTKPPIHDIIKLARFLRISLEEVEAAVLRDEAPQRVADEPLRGAEAVVPLLEQAIELLGWTDEQTAAALHTTREQVRSWRRGAETMPLPEFITLAALIGLHAAGVVGAQSGIAEVAEVLARGSSAERSGEAAAARSSPRTRQRAL